ncbi:MAG TPA: trypsin-like serine protease, partial [Kofleriaceae bacterium]
MSSSLVGCVDGDQIETTRDESEITGVQNTPTRNEQLLATAGKYRDVLYVWSNGFGCTGTVIAPHAVLTARHCIANAGATGFVGWSEFGYMSLPFTNSYTNPYLEPGRRPDWWVALDEQQKASGGRTDDWPAMHDHAVLFVPGLTQAVLDQMRVQLAQLDPNEPTDHYAIVGVGSTGGARRDWGDTRLVPATPNAITNTSTRDGYLTRDGINYGSSIGDAGDSGGPTFGFQHVVLPRRNAAGTTTVEIGHALVGTTQNSLDMAPLAYVSNMTPNQRDTVRLNQLWIA